MTDSTSVIFLSGYSDSNGGPLGPKPSTLTNCATSRTGAKLMLFLVFTTSRNSHCERSPSTRACEGVRFECGAFWCRIGKEDLLQGLGKGDTEKCENRVYGSLANNCIVRKFRYCRPFTIVDKPLYMYIGGMILLFLFLKSEKSLEVFCFCKNPSE